MTITITLEELQYHERRVADWLTTRDEHLRHTMAHILRKESTANEIMASIDHMPIIPSIVNLSR